MLQEEYIHDVYSVLTPDLQFSTELFYKELLRECQPPDFPDPSTWGNRWGLCVFLCSVGMRDKLTFASLLSPTPVSFRLMADLKLVPEVEDGT